MSKTKKVELKGYVVHGVGQTGFDRYDSISFTKTRIYSGDAEATLTIEVPIPEKSVTITESEFENLKSEFYKNPGTSFHNLENYDGFLKSKLIRR